MERKELFKRLNRKLKRAVRRSEPYEQWLPQMARLDKKIALEDTTWVAGAYLKAIEV